jgi:hypothetical protein
MSPAYRKYLSSPHWKALRQAALEHYGPYCQCCKANGPVDVHHTDYRGDLAAVTIQDLLPLCRRCHDVAHQSKAIRDLHLDEHVPPRFKREKTLRVLRLRLLETPDIVEIDPTANARTAHRMLRYTKAERDAKALATALKRLRPALRAAKKKLRENRNFPLSRIP